MPSPVFGKVHFQPVGINQRADEQAVPACRHVTDQIDKQVPVACVVHAEKQLGLAGELVKPGEHGRAQPIAREQAARILAELRQHCLAGKGAATCVVVVGTLAVELTTIVGHECDADEIALDEIRKFGVNVQTQASRLQETG